MAIFWSKISATISKYFIIQPYFHLFWTKILIFLLIYKPQPKTWKGLRKRLIKNLEKINSWTGFVELSPKSFRSLQNSNFKYHLLFNSEFRNISIYIHATANMELSLWQFFCHYIDWLILAVSLFVIYTKTSCLRSNNFLVMFMRWWTVFKLKGL
jgi:hypothetical protein